MGQISSVGVATLIRLPLVVSTGVCWPFHLHFPSAHESFATCCAPFTVYCERQRDVSGLESAAWPVRGLSDARDSISSTTHDFLPLTSSGNGGSHFPLGLSFHSLKPRELKKNYLEKVLPQAGLEQAALFSPNLILLLVGFCFMCISVCPA